MRRAIEFVIDIIEILAVTALFVLCAGGALYMAFCIAFYSIASALALVAITAIGTIAIGSAVLMR